MHKSVTKCNETIDKWYKNKHEASKIIDTFETYHSTSIDPSRSTTSKNRTSTAARREEKPIGGNLSRDSTSLPLSTPVDLGPAAQPPDGMWLPIEIRPSVNEFILQKIWLYLNVASWLAQPKPYVFPSAITACINSFVLDL
jgi:hypothetical protein